MSAVFTRKAWLILNKLKNVRVVAVHVQLWPLAIIWPALARIRGSSWGLRARFAEDFVLKDQIEFKGASGAAYRFRLAENGDPKTTISGNFIYVRGDSTPEVVYAGATSNLAVGVREKWDEAVKSHGATQIYTRLNVGAAARAQELDDIVEGLHPVMNEAHAN